VQQFGLRPQLMRLVIQPEIDMQIEIDINDTVLAEVEISTVIDAINNLPSPMRWNYMTQILNNFYDDINALTEEQNRLLRSS